MVIEIGPGLGTLTQKLLEKAKKVIAIELDKKWLKYYKTDFIIHKPRNYKWGCIKSRFKGSNRENGFKTAKIVANLPYYITTPIIMQLLEKNYQ